MFNNILSLLNALPLYIVLQNPLDYFGIPWQILPITRCFTEFFVVPRNFFGFHRIPWDFFGVSLNSTRISRNSSGTLPRNSSSSYLIDNYTQTIRSSHLTDTFSIHAVLQRCLSLPYMHRETARSPSMSTLFEALLLSMHFALAHRTASQLSTLPGTVTR